MNFEDNRDYVPTSFAAAVVLVTLDVDGTHFLSANRQGRHKYQIPFERHGNRVYYNWHLFHAFLKVIASERAGIPLNNEPAWFDFEAENLLGIDPLKPKNLH